MPLWLSITLSISAALSLPTIAASLVGFLVSRRRERQRARQAQQRAAVERVLEVFERVAHRQTSWSRYWAVSASIDFTILYPRFLLARHGEQTGRGLAVAAGPADAVCSLREGHPPTRHGRCTAPARLAEGNDDNSVVRARSASGSPGRDSSHPGRCAGVGYDETSSSQHRSRLLRLFSGGPCDVPSSCTRPPCDAGQPRPPSTVDAHG